MRKRSVVPEAHVRFGALWLPHKPLWRARPRDRPVPAYHAAISARMRSSMTKATHAEADR